MNWWVQLYGYLDNSNALTLYQICQKQNCYHINLDSLTLYIYTISFDVLVISFELHWKVHMSIGVKTKTNTFQRLKNWYGEFIYYRMLPMQLHLNSSNSFKIKSFINNSKSFNPYIYKITFHVLKYILWMALEWSYVYGCQKQT